MLLEDLSPETIEDHPGIERKLKEISNLIQRDCQPYIRANPAEPLFRGTKNAPDFFLHTVRKDRKPKDTAPHIHEEIDYWFREKFGYPYRSAGLMTTGSDGQAREYGEEYAVFPVGKFKFCWSPNIGDMTGDFEWSVATAYKKKTGKHGAFGKVPEDFELDYVEEFMDDAGYKETDLNAAIKSNNEVMIACNQAYMVAFKDLKFYYHGEVFDHLIGRK